MCGIAGYICKQNVERERILSTLDLMKKTYEPTLSLEFCKGEPRVGISDRIIIRNDGNGVAKNVKVYYRFYIEQRVSGEMWEESENDLEDGAPILELGNLSAGRELRKFIHLKEDAYAIRIQAEYEDVLGEDYKDYAKVYLEDAETC